MQKSRVLLDFPYSDERVFRSQATPEMLHHLANDSFEEVETIDEQEFAGSRARTAGNSRVSLGPTHHIEAVRRAHREHVRPS